MFGPARILMVMSLATAQSAHVGTVFTLRMGEIEPHITSLRVTLTSVKDAEYSIVSGNCYRLDGSYYAVFLVPADAPTGGYRVTETLYWKGDYDDPHGWPWSGEDIAVEVGKCPTRRSREVS